jgi:hypothetical protein
MTDDGRTAGPLPIMKRIGVMNSLILIDPAPAGGLSTHSFGKLSFFKRCSPTIAPKLPTANLQISRKCTAEIYQTIPSTRNPNEV